MNTIEIEEKYAIPFINKISISIERGKGIYVWDENGNEYIDFTAGWGVTCLGHSNQVIIDALIEQSKKVMQNPCSGLTYSPARAKLLSLMSEILPENLKRVFFSNSGAEANDAVIKLARKVSGRLDIISTIKSFHGRTISTASATGQIKHREKFNPLMPNYRFVPFNDVDAIEKELDKDVAAVLLEPIQGEGGVNIPVQGYMEKVYNLCKENGTFLIIDEIQTGFCRTGPMFAIDEMNIKADFLTMAKGIAGGFPFGAFAVTEEIAQKVDVGDHGGTYCGNPLGCAVSYAVIKYILDNNLQFNAKSTGEYIASRLIELKNKYPELILDIRAKGLLIAIEFKNGEIASKIFNECLNNGLLLNLTQSKIIRIFPALNINKVEADKGLDIFKKVLKDV